MKQFTPADGPVNVMRYTLYSMIPGLDTFAVSKLDKKRPALIITIISMAVLLTFSGFIMYQIATDPDLTSDMEKEQRAEITYEKYMPRITLIILGFLAIYLPVITYLVRKWAIAWNKNFEK